jgi:predicted MPP superfamily phosphohydrolase
MRVYSLFSIILLCVAILLVDMLAFYWLKSVTQFIESTLLIKSIDILFWTFTIGLITSILVLKIKLDRISSRRKQLLISSLYGLTVSSFIPKVIFVIIISLLYFTNYVFSETDSLVIVPLFGLFAGFLPFFAILYAIFRSLYRFKVHHIKLNHSQFPKEFDGLKIIHISDIHLGSFNYRYHIFDRAVNIINELNPDFIFFTGDLVNNFSWELHGWEDTFKNLKASKGKYSVLGNHDYGDYSVWDSNKEKQENFEEIKDFHRKTGFTLLLNEATIYKNSDKEIAIIGVENWGNPPFKQYGDLEKAIKDVKDISFKILLSHDPSHWDNEVVNQTDIALTLSGHTHGMQAGFHLKNKKWSPIKYKYKHWAGLYTHKKQFLYVTRGLGWLGFPGRLGMRPEITSIEIFKDS